MVVDAQSRQGRGCGGGGRVLECGDDAQELGRVSLHIHWKAVQTYSTSKSCWGIKVQRQQRYILM